MAPEARIELAQNFSRRILSPLEDRYNEFELEYNTKKQDKYYNTFKNLKYM